MNLNGAECRSAFAVARVARLATADADGQPHLVPVTFAVDGDHVFFAVDAKPKRSTALKRLSNIEQNSAVSLLVDEYDEEWERLWWVRADGRARILPAPQAGAEDGGSERELAIGRLRAKYPQYADVVLTGPVVEIEVTRWSGWRFA